MYSILLNNEIIYTTTNIDEAHIKLEEFALDFIESRNGIKDYNIIRKTHATEQNCFYAISFLDRIEIWKIRCGYLYNNRQPIASFYLIRYKKKNRPYTAKKNKLFRCRQEMEYVLNELPKSND